MPENNKRFKGTILSVMGERTQCLVALLNSLVRSRIGYGCIVYQSSTKTALKMFGLVYDLGLRLSTGAQRTSPIRPFTSNPISGPLSINKRTQLWCRLQRLLRGRNTLWMPLWKITHTINFLKMTIHNTSLSFGSVTPPKGPPSSCYWCLLYAYSWVGCYMGHLPNSLWHVLQKKKKMRQTLLLLSTCCHSGTNTKQLNSTRMLFCSHVFLCCKRLPSHFVRKNGQEH